MKTKSLIFLIFSLLWPFAIGRSAELRDGAVFRVINTGKQPAQALTISSSGTNACTAANNISDLKQQWYVTGNATEGFILRNVSSGAYLTFVSGLYTPWPMVFSLTVNPATMALVPVQYSNGDYGLKPVGANGGFSSNIFAHSGNDNVVVNWKVEGSPNSLWRFEEVEYTPDQIAEMLERFNRNVSEIESAATYQKYLDALFSDKSCTELKNKEGDYASTEEYLNLPPILQNMVRKVGSGEWDETNVFRNTSCIWNSTYAKRYRIQLYEPYSEGSMAAGLAGIQAYTNMNNPTGILADADDLLYIMVEDDVPEGSTLYINGTSDSGMYNSVTEGTKLHKGLNIVLCQNDNTHYFIYYTVNTVGSNKTLLRKVTEFDPIKIHIEGGRINGFFNSVGDKLYGQDTIEEFEYTVQRATHPMYDLLGKYVILHFHLFDTPSHVGGTDSQRGVKTCLFTDKRTGDKRRTDPQAIMKAWDEMCFSERILMGLQSDDDVDDPFNRGYYESIVYDGNTFSDGKTTYTSDPGFHYSDYFNNRMMGISQQGDLYMNATSWRTAYNVSTIEYVLTEFYGDGLWGPAHEYGHMNQGPINMAGTTETSNNIFSNVATYFSEFATTSRSEYISTQLADFMADKSFLKYTGSFGTTRMFWQLWCYYHATGHNKKFYPRLYELLRRYPINKSHDSNGVYHPAKDHLHFAKMCCIAAQEDLTNFFKAWGFFVPYAYHIDDYAQYNAVLTQEEIDEVLEEIKNFHLQENNAIILIDDRPGSPLPSEGGFSKENAGQYGGLDAFRKGASVTGDFSYNVDVNKVTVTANGNPGAGYLIWDDEGNLLGFSNSDNFEVSPEVAAKLMDGTAKISAVGADNSTKEAVNTVLNGSVEDKKNQLTDQIGRCLDYLRYVDDTYTRVGFIKPEAAVALKRVLEEAQNRLADANITGNQLTDIIIKIQNEYNALIDNQDALIELDPEDTYLLTNFNYGTLVLSANSQRCIAVTHVDEEKLNFDRQWIFEPAEDADKYYIKNSLSNLYINTPGRSSAVPVSPEPQSFTFIPLKNSVDKIGVFTFAPAGNTSLGIHIDGSHNVVGWNTSSNPTQWYITKINDIEAEEAELKNYYKGKLQEIIDACEKRKSLVDPTNTKVGYFCENASEKFNDLEENISSIMKEGNPTIEYLRVSYEKMASDYNNLLSDPEITIGIEEGALYVIQNFSTERPGVMATNGTTVNKLTPGSENGSFTAQWLLEPTSNGRYYIRNYEYNSYINVPGAQNRDCTMGMGQVEFQLVPITGNTGVFALAPGGSTGMALHLSSYGNVWQYTYTASASQWTLTKIHDKSYVELRAQLDALLQRSEEVLNSAGEFYSPEAEMMVFDPDVDNGDLYTNAPYTASANGDDFKGWECILDNDVNTYFHSDYSGNNSKDGLDHYIRFRAPGDDSFRYFVFQYTTRNSDGVAAKISAFRIEGSKDSENWETLYTVSSGLNTNKSTVNVTPEIEAPEGTKYIRFVVTKNGGQTAGGHPFFALAQIKIVNRHTRLMATPSTSLPDLKVEDMLEFNDVIQNTRSSYNNPAVPAAKLEEMLNDLIREKEEFEALLYCKCTINTSEVFHNDGVDNNDDPYTLRQAFSTSGENIFPDLIHLDGATMPSLNEIAVEVTAVNSSEWVKKDADADITDEDYLSAFNEWEDGEEMWSLYQAMEYEIIDGFYTSATASLGSGASDDVYNLVLDAPCSGVYEIRIFSTNPGVKIVDENGEVPTLSVCIYPNLKAIFGNGAGINIEGYYFDESDGKHDKTIYLPNEFIQNADMRHCSVYIPGTYFNGNLTATTETVGSDDNDTDMSAKREAASGNMSGTAHKAIVDLSDLADSSAGSKKLNVEVEKNGATAGYTFYVAAGNNDNIVTGMEALGTDEADSETIYYNLQGIRIDNPEKGLYITVKGNKRSKVLKTR